jgi:hypothetical protein
MKVKILFLIVLLLPVFLRAQEIKTYTEKQYAKEPIWIAMADDTLTNYYEAEKAYAIYWQHHERPETEHDVIGERQEREKTLSRRKLRKIEEEDNMRMEVRKYEKWHELILPYVKQDGRIMYPSERLQLWESLKSK